MSGPHEVDSLGERMSISLREKLELVEHVERGPVIELGCGVGTVLAGCKTRFPEGDLWGIEMDPELASRARIEVPGATILEGNVLEPDPWEPSLPHEFGAVVLFSMLHEVDWPHGWQAVESVIRLANRLLRPGGLLLLRDGAKPPLVEDLALRFKTDYARRKTRAFEREYRQRPMNFVWHGDDGGVNLSSHDLHDLLNKYYFEGDLWKRDMHESFGRKGGRDYARLCGRYFEVLHFATSTPGYLRERWSRDFEVDGFPTSHVAIVARKP